MIDSAVHVFARSGLSGTTVADVADHAGISPAYVFKLFSGKTPLFVAALEHCYARILDVLEAAASRSPDATPADVLDRLGAAYADLIADRDVLMLQVHAQAAVDDPAIAETVRAGIARITDLAAARSRAGDTEVQRFMAYGQLCHLLTAVDAFTIDEPWATTLTAAIRHTEPTPPHPH
ncbi:TetR family transcriptional regulator [Haloactinopolyspora alba]|uniref:TetR family transcriptional regulator n=1 Tax=Haloactinopolyspora alba TaxID=648780 RepID=A0A2P8DM07_9ACTN|nr:TetR family transcriptional regulator [Haloactinopolyspora alba]